MRWKNFLAVQADCGEKNFQRYQQNAVKKYFQRYQDSMKKNFHRYQDAVKKFSPLKSQILKKFSSIFNANFKFTGNIIEVSDKRRRSGIRSCWHTGGERFETVSGNFFCKKSVNAVKDSFPPLTTANPTKINFWPNLDPGLLSIWRRQKGLHITKNNFWHL